MNSEGTTPEEMLRAVRDELPAVVKTARTGDGSDDRANPSPDLYRRIAARRTWPG